MDQVSWGSLPRGQAWVPFTLAQQTAGFEANVVQSCAGTQECPHPPQTPGCWLLSAPGFGCIPGWQGLRDSLTGDWASTPCPSLPQLGHLYQDRRHGASPAPLLPLPGAGTWHQFTLVHKAIRKSSQTN